MERFRDATGKDVGALEEEKARAGALEGRSKAQVRGGGREPAGLGGAGRPPGSLGALTARLCSQRLHALPACPPSTVHTQPSTPLPCPRRRRLQAEMNLTLTEQVALLRGQKELHEARADKAAAEAKKLAAKVRGGEFGCRSGGQALHWPPSTKNTAPVPVQQTGQEAGEGAGGGREEGGRG